MFGRKQLEIRVKELEQKACRHEMEYYWSFYGFVKKCKKCGKEEWITREDWLQEQADLHHKKHCQFIEMIKKETEETSKEAEA